MYGLKEGEEYYPWLWPVPENGVIGKRRVRRLDGYEKASGKAIYARSPSENSFLLSYQQPNFTPMSGESLR
jgi:hypothetical protein